jgi:toxin-antitoxin system PIN domain toxin
MIILDANILLYAYNSDAPQQKAAAQWLGKLLDGGELIGLPWITVWAFIRISTNARFWANPRPAKEAFAIIAEWLTQPGVVPIQPGPLHAEILQKLVLENSATGPLVTDAVLAALAMEHGAELASTDRGFSRYQDLRWQNPLAG